jgi:hypothetical protein
MVRMIMVTGQIKVECDLWDRLKNDVRCVRQKMMTGRTRDAIKPQIE